MQSTKVYLIEGHTGEYSDRDSWPVRVYTNKKLANSLAKRFTKLIRKHIEEAGADYRDWDEIYENKEIKEFDSRFHMDYTGTWYTVKEVELNNG